jgi:hypothetical protein
MQTDRETLLRVVRDPLQLLELQGPVLDVALRQLRRAKLLGRVGEQLHAAGRLHELPVRLRDQLQSARCVAHARARLVRWEMLQLSRILEPHAGRPVVVLKGGAYLLQNLPLAAGRILTDVDLLVPEFQLDATEARLRSAGWESAPMNDYDQRYYREWTHEIPPLRHAEREIEVDVHHSIIQRTSRFQTRAALLLERVQAAGTGGLLVLSPLDQVLHAMTHLFASGEMDDAVRELVDIDALLRHFAALDSGFWLMLPERARELDLHRPAIYALRYCRRWLHTPVPESTLRALHGLAPAWPVRSCMDLLVPHALFPRHPDLPSRFSSIARALLLARSHFIRMPPGLLFRHLAIKAWRRA